MKLSKYKRTTKDVYVRRFLDAWSMMCPNKTRRPICEFRFHPERRWRADIAWPDAMLLVEIDGGTWSGGRHTTGSGFAKDAEKLNAAAVLGYRVLRFTTTQIRDDVVKCINQVRALLAMKETGQ